MASFTYTARDQRGAVQVGHLDAISEDEVVAILQHRGLLVTSISYSDVARSLKKPVVGRAGYRMHTGVTTNDQVTLCQQLATLVEAGIPLLRSLEVVSSQVESRMLLVTLEEVRHNVEAGRTFRDALSKHPAVFSKLWLNLAQTGETSGHLAQALQQLARHFEAARHLQNQVRTAMTYPMVLIVMAVLVLSVFVYWLIPKFTLVFDALGAELPPLTQFIINTSTIARQYFVIIVFGTAAAGYFLRRYLRTEAGRWMCDRLVLRLPTFKMLFVYVQLAEFSRGLATLLESGVPLLSSLEILEDSATNRVYGRAVSRVKEFVREGKTMAEPLAESGMFPPMVVQMVQVGEEVGELAKMASRIAKYYEERVETFIARLSQLFEPIAIVVMGALVLIIVLSIFLPLFNLAGGATRQVR